MSRDILSDIEFEKNRQAILRQRGKEVLPDINDSNDGNKKYAWEYELEEYRKSKAREKFYVFGAVCGILSLIITLFLNYRSLMEIIGM